MIKHIFNFGFLTGSRAIGGNSKDSDWDIVVLVKDKEDIDEIIQKTRRIREVKSSEYFNGTKYVMIDDVTINIIPVPTSEFIGWYLATVSMAEQYRRFWKSPATGYDKKLRCQLFESIKVSCRPYTDGISNPNEFNTLIRKASTMWETEIDELCSQVLV